MTFRPDTSFPFLKIARETGSDYGRVLRYAEGIWSAWREPDTYGHPALAAIWNAVLAERQRRATAIHRARHNGEAP